MNVHPAKLLILFPMYQPEGVRQRLSAIDDALVVHRDVEGRFRFEMRDMVRLGPRSYAKWLIRFAADLAAGYVAVVVGRDAFLADVERLARDHVSAADRDALELAVQTIAERTRHQILDPVEGEGDRECQIYRMVIVRRPKRVGKRDWSRHGVECINGIPVPRVEQLWRVYCGEWCDVRGAQHGLAAWKDWARRNRPNLPVGENPERLA
jgi:hypothetical protein